VHRELRLATHFIIKQLTLSVMGLSWWAPRLTERLKPLKARLQPGVSPCSGTLKIQQQLTNSSKIFLTL
jgi:hypothetical protein